MRLRSLVPSALLVTTLLFGCGGGGTSDEDQVRQVVDQFTAALAQRDGETAWSYLTDDLQQKYGDSSRVVSCASMLGANSVPESLTISKATVTGTTATVAFQNSANVLNLTKVGDSWLISGL